MRTEKQRQGQESQSNTFKHLDNLKTSRERVSALEEATEVMKFLNEELVKIKSGKLSPYEEMSSQTKIMKRLKGIKHAK